MTLPVRPGEFAKTKSRFLQYRVALMEAGIEMMGIAHAVNMIPPNGPDPYRMIQVYDCKDVSF